MRAVLGIDAAWTKSEPSGVALLVDDGTGWRQLKVAPSYGAFIASCAGDALDWSSPAAPGVCDASALLTAAAQVLGNGAVTIIAIDMPISTEPIHTRRVADNDISRAFGGNGCSVHSPNNARPGALGEALQHAFAAHGYIVATAATSIATSSVLLEVYPHVALLSLLKTDYRIPYKISRSRKYWPGTSVAERQMNLIRQFARIREALAYEISEVDLAMPAVDGLTSLAELKRYEDALDALVCAWVGSRYLDGDAVAYGDNTAAIWVPADPRGANPTE